MHEGNASRGSRTSLDIFLLEIIHNQVKRSTGSVSVVNKQHNSQVFVFARKLCPWLMRLPSSDLPPIYVYDRPEGPSLYTADCIVLLCLFRQTQSDLETTSHRILLMPIGGSPCEYYCLHDPALRAWAGWVGLVAAKF